MDLLLKIITSLLLFWLTRSLGLNGLSIGFLLWIAYLCLSRAYEAQEARYKANSWLSPSNGQGVDQNDNRLHFKAFFNFDPNSFNNWFNKGRMDDGYSSQKRGSWKTVNKNQPKPILTPQQKLAQKRRENQKFVQNYQHRR